GGQRYMTVVSAGVHNAGLVSLNEAGLFLGVHTIPTTKVNKEGVPVFMLANQIMKSARSFDDASALFGRVAVPSGWTYTMASINERRVGSVEINNSGISLRTSEGGLHVQTNRYMTEKFAGHELFFNKSVDQDSDARYARIQQMAEQ